MNYKLTPLSIDEASVKMNDRPSSGGSTVQIGWSVSEEQGGALRAGFSTWHGDVSPFKTLNYDEILLVLEGYFGFELEDGNRYEGGPGTTMRINKNTPVRYFGEHAKVFFVITPPSE